MSVAQTVLRDTFLPLALSKVPPMCFKLVLEVVVVEGPVITKVSKSNLI